VKPTIKELQQKIAELEEELANRVQEQVKIRSLEEWNRIFEAVVSQSPAAILITNDQGKIEYVNESFHQTLGYSPDELQDDFMYSILRDNEDISKYEELKNTIQKDKIWKGEIRAIKKDQHVIWIRLVVFPLFQLDKIKKFVAIFNDVSGLKVIETERQERENLYSSLIENIPLAITIFDENGVIIFNNANTEKIFNQSNQISTGKTLQQILPKKAADELMEQYRQIYETGQPMKAISNIYWQGQMLNLDVTRLPLFDKEGRVTRIITLMQNITEQTRQEKLLNIKQQMLIQKSRLESLGELSAGLAHEISQPLSVISLVMENINYKMEQQQASAEYLAGKFGTITQNINKIRELIDHVRIFSRDQGNIMFERVDVNQVILSSLSMIESQIKNLHIKIITDLSDDIGYTVGNPSRFEQVILNLLSNSRDALVEKGNKILYGSRSQKILIKTSIEKNRVIARVWDNGTGISPENLDKIFNPFFTTKTDGSGTGLGLPIVYGIITEMKGKITAKSKEGEFTEITITLPRYKKIVEKK